MDTEFLTIEELANMLKVVRATIYQWKKKGLPYIKIGRNIRFDKESVLKWIKSMEIKDTEAIDQREVEKQVEATDQDFRRWCLTRGIDYQKLTDEGVMKIIEEGIKATRSKLNAESGAGY